MNILLLGSGGRESALSWKIAQSKKLKKLYIAPGNAGTSIFGTNLPVDPEDFSSVKEAIILYDINIVIVGPEGPLVLGIHDFIANDPDIKHVAVVGPRKDGAILEGSKDFAKKFMAKYNIPTAAYKSFTLDTIELAFGFLESLKPPYVLKADGLAAGKGVIIVDNIAEARSSLKEMLEGQFGEASKTVVIEEFLKGIELSVFVITDGESYKILPEAKDYKRIGEGDTGLNTGGMGAVSPVPFADKKFLDKIEQRIIIPTVEGLKNEGIDYQGFIFFGLIKVEDEPYVIEYNVRMGDPETEVVIPRISSDIVELFEGVANRNLYQRKISIDERFVTAVMLVSSGYPGNYEKCKTITNLVNISESLVFHAGTKLNDENIVTCGGRVIAVSSYGKTMDEALGRSYRNAGIINFSGKYYRKDIGFDLNN